MESIINSEKHNIEFRYITGQDMIEEVKQLFRLCSIIRSRSCFLKFWRKLETLPGKYGPPNGVLILALDLKYYF